MEPQNLWKTRRWLGLDLALALALGSEYPSSGREDTNQTHLQPADSCCCELGKKSAVYLTTVNVSCCCWWRDWGWECDCDW